MNTETRARELHEYILDHKRHLWGVHGKRDMQPAAMATFEGAEYGVDLNLEGALGLYFSNPSLKAMSGGKPPSPSHLAARMLASLIADDPTIPLEMKQVSGHALSTLIIACDTHMLHVDDAESREEAEEKLKQMVTNDEGDFAKDFAENPETKVVEAMHTAYWERTATGVNMVTIIQKYRMSDGGVLDFDDPVVDVHEDADASTLPGHMNEIIRPIFDLEGAKS